MAYEPPNGRPFQKTLHAEVDQSYYLEFMMNKAAGFWPPIQNNVENKLRVKFQRNDHYVDSWKYMLKEYKEISNSVSWLAALHNL